MNQLLHRRGHRAAQPQTHAGGSEAGHRVRVSPPDVPQNPENHYETLLCLKYGRLYGVISPEAYESGKVDLLARL